MIIEYRMEDGTVESVAVMTIRRVEEWIIAVDIDRKEVRIKGASVINIWVV